MWAVTLIVASIVLGLIAFSFAIGVPMLAVPFAIGGILAMGVLHVERRRRHDRETLVSE